MTLFSLKVCFYERFIKIGAKYVSPIKSIIILSLISIHATHSYIQYTKIMTQNLSFMSDICPSSSLCSQSYLFSPHTLPDSFVYCQICSFYTLVDDYLPMLKILDYLNLSYTHVCVHILTRLVSLFQTFHPMFVSWMQLHWPS